MPPLVNKISEFSSGTWEPQIGYQSFLPHSINADWLVDDLVLQQLLSRADYKLGMFHAALQWTPSGEILSSIFEKLEAAYSCRMDGIDNNLHEALMFESEIQQTTKKNWQLVQKCQIAMDKSAKALEQAPFTTRRMKDTHKLMLPSSIEGYNLPGEYRSGQFWVDGSSVRNAQYVPPHFSQIVELMKDLENFMTNTELHTPFLIRAGIALSQMESIHPFGVGNGRVARTYLLLYLIGSQLLSTPSLCLSAYFSKHRQQYDALLKRVRTDHDMSGWLQFFLTGIIQTADVGITTIDKVALLKYRIETEILGKKVRRSGSSEGLLALLFAYPVLSGQKIKQLMGSNDATTNRLIDQFVAGGILQEKTGFRRNRMFEFGEYLAAFG